MMVLTVAAGAAAKKFTLVIDAGHGGHDTGAIGKITKEKTINLNVALAFGKLVERNCPDVKVIYTRKSDVFIPLHTRADIANQNKADLFISIHTNALPKGRISRGLETYTLGMHRAADNLDVAKRENAVILIEKDYKQRYQGFDPNSSESYIMFEFIQDHNMAQSVELAKFVQKRTCAAAGRADKGVKQAGFLVLRETSMPSCLIELGFISTADEERYLSSSDGVSQLGRGIYQAFLDYKKKYDKSGVVPSRVEEETTATTVTPQQEEKKKEEEVKVEKPKRKKSKVAQELAAVREGKSVAGTDDQSQPAVASTDSIVMEEPAPAAEEQAALPEKPAALPEKPAALPEKPAALPEKPAALSEKPAPAVAKVSSKPVFKVQILASSARLKKNDARLKGQSDAECYEEGGMYKYTVGASEDYNAIARLRKSLLSRFPEAFIIAFKNGSKTDVRAAIQEFKTNR